MNKAVLLLDSSAWIELFRNGPLAKSCLKELKSAAQVIVPTLVQFEVYRKLSSSTSEDQALSAIAHMSQYAVKELSPEVALLAGDLSILHKLGAMDSLILAHAHSEEATLITLDNDFTGLKDVKVLRS